MSEPVKIAVVLERGKEPAILSAGVAVRAVLVDYDSADEPGAVELQCLKRTGYATVSELPIAMEGAAVLELFDVAAEPLAPQDMADQLAEALEELTKASMADGLGSDDDATDKAARNRLFDAQEKAAAILARVGVKVEG